jgi:hypothetical protein
MLAMSEGSIFLSSGHSDAPSAPWTARENSEYLVSKSRKSSMFCADMLVVYGGLQYWVWRVMSDPRVL